MYAHTVTKRGHHKFMTKAKTKYMYTWLKQCHFLEAMAPTVDARHHAIDL